MSEKFVAKVRFDCKPNLPGPGSETVIFSKIDTYGVIDMPPLRGSRGGGDAFL